MTTHEQTLRERREELKQMYPKAKGAETWDNDDYSGIGYRPAWKFLDIVVDRVSCWNINREETNQKPVPINWSGHTKREFIEFRKMEDGKEFNEKLMNGYDIMGMGEFMELPQSKQEKVMGLIHSCIAKPPEGRLTRDEYMASQAKWERWGGSM